MVDGVQINPNGGRDGISIDIFAEMTLLKVGGSDL